MPCVLDAVFVGAWPARLNSRRDESFAFAEACVRQILLFVVVPDQLSHVVEVSAVHVGARTWKGPVPSINHNFEET